MDKSSVTQVQRNYYNCSGGFRLRPGRPRPIPTRSTGPIPTENWSLPVSRHTLTFFASGLPSQKNPAPPLDNWHWLCVQLDSEKKITDLGCCPFSWWVYSVSVVISVRRSYQRSVKMFGELCLQLVANKQLLMTKWCKLLCSKVVHLYVYYKN